MHTFIVLVPSSTCRIPKACSYRIMSTGVHAVVPSRCRFSCLAYIAQEHFESLIILTEGNYYVLRVVKADGPTSNMAGPPGTRIQYIPHEIDHAKTPKTPECGRSVTPTIGCSRCRRRSWRRCTAHSRRCWDGSTRNVSERGIVCAGWGLTGCLREIFHVMGGRLLLNIITSSVV